MILERIDRRNLRSSITLTVIICAILFSLTSMQGFAVSNEKEIYVTARPEGRVLTPFFQFLSYKSLVRNLKEPRDIVCGPEGMLYLAETGKRRIISVDHEGNFQKVVVKDLALIGDKSHRPVNMTFGPDGDLFFTTVEKEIWRLKDADPLNKPERLLKYNFFDPGESPSDIAFLKTGDYANDLVMTVTTDRPYRGYVVRLTAPDYKQVREFISGYSIEEMGVRKDESLKIPTGITVKESGEIFVADRDIRERHILQYSPDGSFQKVFIDGIVDPIDLDLDSEGNLYLTVGPMGEEVKGGSLKIFNRKGEQIQNLPRSGLWGVEVCDS